jgi:hypothetical protein
MRSSSGNPRERAYSRRVVAALFAIARQRSRRFEAAAIAGNYVECFGHPRWLYRGGATIPHLPLHFREPRAVSEADIALCKRLIDAYGHAQAAAPPTSGLWASWARRHQRELLEALERRDPLLLANRLASMFRSEFVRGMTQDAIESMTQARWSRRLLCMHTLDRLVSLAESLGSAHSENPEQPGVGLAFVESVERLVLDAEAALGVSLNFPNVGAAFGLEIAGRLITPNCPDQVYGAARLRHAIQEHLADRESRVRVVEIGGGYGAIAYWLLQLMDVPYYTIIDLPLTNVIHGYFLAQALGAGEVSYYGEPTARVIVLPTHALEHIDVPFDVLVNKDSMPEIPEPGVREYLNWGRDNCTGIFFSYNQEGAVPVDGTPQNVVHEVLDKVGGFARIRRDRSWVRAGYVEEIFRAVAS